MDTVTFHFENIPEDSKYKVRLEARRFFSNKQKLTTVEAWFYEFCADIIIDRIFGDIEPKSSYIVDYKITMPKDKYVEFCLRWL
jgi:hypothetical protein